MFILHPLFKYKIYLFVKEKVRSAALLTHQEKVLAPGIVWETLNFHTKILGSLKLKT